MGILFIPITLTFKLVILLPWLAATALKLALFALKLVWRFVAAVFAVIGTLISAVLPGKKQAGDRPSSGQDSY